MYVPLRVHGWHSHLVATASPRALLRRSAELGLEAMALTDVDSIGGIVDFLRAAEEIAAEDPARAVRPIVGAELSNGRGPGRVVALVEDERGWRNLCRLVSARRLGADPGEVGAALEAEDAPTPEDFDLALALARRHEGLVLLVDHPRLLVSLAGRVPRERLLAAISPAALQLGRPRRGTPRRRNTHLAPPERYAPRGGEGSEAPEHELAPPKTPPPAQATAARELLEAARAVGAAIVAAPDVYLAHAAERADHLLRVAIRHNALAADLPLHWIAPEPAHLSSDAELRALYAELPDAAGAWPVTAEPGEPPPLARTRLVAERCRYTPPLGGVLFPDIELEQGETPYSRLSSLALEGLRRRYRPLRPEALRRLDTELSTIDRLGFAPYFLLVHRIREWAAREGIPCVGRGSAADSLVAYCLGLTDADPLRYRLLFERFLNPARGDRPDIDLDFCWRRRDRVIEHVYELLGHERTAMIATLATFGLRAAFRESALALGIPPVEVNRWSRRLPHHAPPAENPAARARTEETSPLERALRAVPEARGFPFEDPRWRRALRLAGRLVGTPRHLGLHPGGVVVAPGPITDYVACQRAAKGVVVTQLDKDGVEALGLVKMDLLGNRALTVIDDATRVLAGRGIEVDLERIPEDDPDVARALREGRTLGCFQIESPGMRHLLQQTGARDMAAVIQAIALIRPGPAGSGMKDAYVRRYRGLEPPAPPHPRLADLLWDTQGVMLYQEDVMQVVSTLAGMDLAEADCLRRALKKRDERHLARLAERFLAGCAENGVARADAERVWELVSNFAAFGFCKAHAVTYGRIAYRTAWLKTHWPAVYLASFLASHTGYYAERVYVEEARRLGVPILGPDVNRSGADWSVEWIEREGEEPIAAIRVGLASVKGLCERTRDALLAARERGGPFLSLPDLLERTGAHVDEAEALVSVGALDAFDRTRPELLWRLHLLRTPARRAPRDPARDGGRPLDPGELAACRATPRTRAEERVAEARARSGGWRGGIGGLGAAGLARGETARLFPEPEAPALALPRLPDLGPRERGELEFDLLGLTLTHHPTRLFPCPADARLAARFGATVLSPAHPGGGLRPVNPIPCAELRACIGGRVTLRGWPAATRRVRTRGGRWMRFCTLEDESGLAEVVLFPDVYERDGHRLAEFGTLCITGIVQDDLGALTLRAERIW